MFANKVNPKDPPVVIGFVTHETMVMTISSTRIRTPVKNSQHLQNNNLQFMHFNSHFM